MGLGSDALLGAAMLLAWPLAIGVLLGLGRELCAWSRADTGAAAQAAPIGPLTFAALLVGGGFAFRAVSLLPGASLDRFGAKEAAAFAILGLAALWLGFSFAWATGVLVRRLLPGATLAVALFLLLDHWRGGSGILGNTGYDMQLLLPGAAVGLFVWCTEPRRLTGLLAFAAALLFAALVPVLGGLCALFVSASLACFAKFPTGGPSRRTLAGILGVTLLLCAGRLLPLPGHAAGPDAGPNASPTETSAPNSELGGLGVRLAIWKSLTALLPHDQEAFGTGQFQALYPPLRDPLELAATTGNHTIEALTDVEHPHNDLLLVFAENGTLPALGFSLALLMLGFFAVRRQLRPTTTSDPALAAGALAMILAGGFHAPLFTNPFGALLGGLLLGALAGRDNAARQARSGGRRALRLGFGLVAAGLLGATLAWQPVRLDAAAKGPELASLETAREAAEAGRLRFDLIAARARIEPTPTEAAHWWDLALELHPFSIEALAGRGLAAVRQGDLFGARKAWLAALELDPAYPIVQNNLARLGADLILAGHLAPGLALLEPHLARAGLAPPFAPRALEDLAATETAPFDAALKSAAAWLHSRELFDAGATSRALLELRRAALLAGHGDRPPAALGAELAVIQSLDGQISAGRARLSALLDAASDPSALLAELPPRLASAAKLLVSK